MVPCTFTSGLEGKGGRQGQSHCCPSHWPGRGAPQSCVPWSLHVHVPCVWGHRLYTVYSYHTATCDVFMSLGSGWCSKIGVASVYIDLTVHVPGSCLNSLVHIHVHVAFAMSSFLMSNVHVPYRSHCPFGGTCRGSSLSSENGLLTSSVIACA